MDFLYSLPLKNYILSTTDEEPLLLAQLRKETAALIGLENMLTGPVEAKFLQMLIKLKTAKKRPILGVSRQ